MRSTFSRRYYFNETESQSRGNRDLAFFITRKFIRTPSFLLLIFFGKPKKLINVNSMIAKKNRLFSCTEVISTYSLVALLAERFLVMLSVFIVPIVATTTGFCLELNNK